MAFDTTDSKVCLNCNNTKPITNFTGKGVQKSTGKKYRDSICRKCRKQQRKHLKLCPSCARPAKEGGTYCNKCLDIMKKSKKRTHAKDKKAAFLNYGEHCALCGESLLEFLTIDHINDDGAEHRRELRSGGNGGHNIYAWLRKNKYPHGFQTLCCNCNMAKSIIGYHGLIKLLKKNNRYLENR